MNEYKSLEPFPFIPYVNNITSMPECNFYTKINDDYYIDNRLFMKRHTPTNVLYDSDNNSIHSFVLPKSMIKTKKIIMPDNFIKISNFQGYFIWDNSIIVNINSNYILDAKHKDKPLNQYSIIHEKDESLYNALTKRLIQYGFINIQQNTSNIVAIDKYFTFVIGAFDNITFND